MFGQSSVSDEDASKPDEDMVKVCTQRPMLDGCLKFYKSLYQCVRQRLRVLLSKEQIFFYTEYVVILYSRLCNFVGFATQVGFAVQAALKAVRGTLGMSQGSASEGSGANTAADTLLVTEQNTDDGEEELDEVEYRQYDGEPISYEGLVQHLGQEAATQVWEVAPELRFLEIGDDGFVATFDDFLEQFESEDVAQSEWNNAPKKMQLDDGEEETTQEDESTTMEQNSEQDDENFEGGTGDEEEEEDERAAEEEPLTEEEETYEEMEEDLDEEGFDEEAMQEEEEEEEDEDETV